MAPHIGAVLSANKATLIECETVYSAEDVYLLFDILRVDAHNQRVMAAQRED